MLKLMVGAGIACLDYPRELYPAMSQFAICNEKYDECNCRAIAISNGKEKIMIMSYDLSDIPEVPDLERKIAAATGFDEKDIVITVTHNHTSPCDRGSRRATEEERQVFRNAFFQYELAASLAAATNAVNSMQPAKYGFGAINSYINVNEVTENSKLGVIYDESTIGYSDKTLAIIKFVDLNNKLICALLNYSCHATFAMGADSKGNYVTSGNFPGITSRFAEDYFGDGAVIAWTSGAAGNQKPVDYPSNGLQYAYTDGYTKRVGISNELVLQFMERAGRQHGIDAVNGINNISVYSEYMPIIHTKKKINLVNQKPVETASVEGIAPLRTDTDYGMGLRSNQLVPAAEREWPKMIEDPETLSELELELLVLGEIGIVGLGCELFCQIGRDIKNSMPIKHTIVVTHTPGYVGGNPHAVGYIVDKSTVGAGIPKEYRNLIPGAYDDMIVNAVLDMCKEAANKD